MGIFDWLGPTSLTRRRDPEPATSTAIATAETRALDLSQPRSLLVDGVPSYWTPTSAQLGPGAAANNSAIEACLAVIAASIIEPPIGAYRPGPTGGAKRVPAPLPALMSVLARPNPSLQFSTMLAFAVLSTRTDGNGYWRKVRSGDPVLGNVVQLWPIAPDRITPYTRPGSDDFITAYEYVDEHGRSSMLDPTNVVHFRYGLDPDDHRLGYAPLRKLLSEVSADEQATRYAARLLANLAVNGLTLSFDKDSPAIDQAQADELKARISAAYGGDNVGGAAVLSPGATLTALGFSPEQMDLGTLHRVPEERICAVLSVPAAMVGLGVGLEHSIYNNVRQAEEHFTERMLIPEWRAVASTLTMSLVPDFTSEKAIFLDFDLSNVRALQEDQDALATRLVTLVAGGILTEDEARAMLSYGPKAAPAPAESRRRPYVVRLPARKAAEDLLGGFDDLRASSMPDWEREVRAFFRAQSGRIAGRLNDGTTSANSLVPESETVLLSETLSPLQLALLDDVVPLVVAELGIAFQLDDPATRTYLRAAGANVGGITDTTRRAVQDALLEGQAAGEGIPDLARRLRDLPAFGQTRATLVARTELGTSQNQAALASYRASGVVVGVRVHDGDDDEICAAVNGRAFALGAQPGALGHPNCTRAFAPITDADELARSA